MDVYKFGGLVKKTVSVDNRQVMINKNTLNLDDIEKVFVTNATLMELGSVILSTDGKSEPNPAISKKGFIFTSKQKDDVEAFLSKIPAYSSEGGVARIDNKAVVCPKCGSDNLQFMQNNRKGFSVGKAVGGAVLTGGIGTLAGFAGKKGKKNTWYCSECGNTFTSKK